MQVTFYFGVLPVQRQLRIFDPTPNIVVVSFQCFLFVYTTAILQALLHFKVQCPVSLRDLITNGEKCGRFICSQRGRVGSVQNPCTLSRERTGTVTVVDSVHSMAYSTGQSISVICYLGLNLLSGLPPR